MEETIKVIALVNEFEGTGDLWFAFDNPSTPQKLFDYIKNNIEEGVVFEVKIDNVPKNEFELEV